MGTRRASLTARRLCAAAGFVLLLAGGAAAQICQAPDALVQRGEAFQALGRVASAQASLTRAVRLAREAGDARQLAVALGALGSSRQDAGLYDSAFEALEESLDLAEAGGFADVAARTLANLGNLHAARGEPRVAAALFGRALELAERERADELVVRILLNRARAQLQRYALEEAGQDVTQAVARLPAAPAADRAFLLTTAGAVMLEAAAREEAGAQVYAAEAERVLARAVDLAEYSGDRRTSSYALGHLGQALERQGRAADALRRSRQAMLQAQRADAPESLYLWQAQTGRLLAAQGDLAGAIIAYRGAVSTLAAVRLDLPRVDAATGELTFRRTIGPVYSALADLLLRQAEREPAREQPLLLEARAAVELLKTAELQDYYKDDCVAALQAKVAAVDRLAERTAAIYPILFEDRVELLVSLPDRMQRFTSPVRAVAVNAAARALRQRLETYVSEAVPPEARQLYEWLIRPVEATLAQAGVETLVVIPDDALRSIPFAVLHDGQNYLVSRFAIATNPGLTLLDPRPIGRSDARILLGGLTLATQGFEALPNVAVELDAVSALYGSRALRDEQFLTASLGEELAGAPYNVLHIASHARFAEDPKDSFLLTFDGRIGLDQLEALIKRNASAEHPLELLTLSACQTASGDDRAALGLAGVAVKAGARSVFATLWSIADEAAGRLVPEFYRQLREPGVSKAEALRRAQLTLIDEPRFRNPSFWAAFLIIGNWL